MTLARTAADTTPTLSDELRVRAIVGQPIGEASVHSGNRKPEFPWSKLKHHFEFRETQCVFFDKIRSSPPNDVMEMALNAGENSRRDID